MPSFNRWGATEAGVLLHFAVGGYTPAAADFGGTDAVAAALDEAANAVAQALPEATLRMLEAPDLEMVVARAAAGQTTATLGAAPLRAGTLHLWAGAPSRFVARPVLATDPDAWEAAIPGPVYSPAGAAIELDEAAFSVATATGVVTLATALARNDQVFASYEVDVDAASFAVPSIAGMVAIGAAAALGAKVYPQASSEWAHVDRLATSFAEYLGEVAAGRMLPPELRRRQWWKEPGKVEAGSWGSVRRLRG